MLGREGRIVLILTTAVATAILWGQQRRARRRREKDARGSRVGWMKKGLQVAMMRAMTMTTEALLLWGRWGIGYTGLGGGGGRDLKARGRRRRL